MSLSVSEYINSTYDSTLASSTTASTELGRDEFLQLLIAQLEWQDPLDPMDDTEMVSQLAQFTSLEEMEAMNESLDSVASLLSTQVGMSAVGYMGKEVEAIGSAMSKDGDFISTVTFTLPEESALTYAHVINEDGDIVASVALGSLSSGDHAFVWDGFDTSGDEADDGQYAIAFTAEDDNGESLTVTTQVSGVVTSIYQENGSTMLGLSDGRAVNLLNVGKVVDTSLTTTEES